MKIRVREYGSGRRGYQLDFGLVAGRRKQKAYKTLEAAERALKAAQKAQERHGKLGAMLTPHDVAEFVLARERLKGVPVIEAVEFYLANARIVHQPLLVKDMVKRFVDYKERQGRGERYREVELPLTAFAETVALRHAHEIEGSLIEAWLHGRCWAPKTRNNVLGLLSSMFRWAVRMKHAVKNPCEDLERAKIPDAEIESLTAAECEQLLKAALEEKHRPLLGFLVIGLFCGIRPEEIERLKWDAVDLEAGTVIVAGAKAKSRKRRVVDLSENARAWLKLAAPTGTKAAGTEALRECDICPRNLRDRWRALRAQCGWTRSGSGGVKDWPQDGMRHTFASMHYAQHQNEALLQVQMGHESKEQLHRHYRAVRTKAEAAAFWAILPPG